MLSLDHNAIDSKGFSIDGLPNVKELSLVHNKLTNESISTLAKGKNITKLNLMGNKFNNENLEQFLSLEKLWELNLSENQITNAEKLLTRNKEKYVKIWLDGNIIVKK